MRIEVVGEVETYFSEDGQRFTREAHCLAHEKKLADLAYREERTKFFDAACKPNLIGGHGYAGALSIAVEISHLEGSHDIYALAALVTLFGNPLAFTDMGTPMESWHLRESDRKSFQNWTRRYACAGDYDYPATALFISNNGPIEGLPIPITIADLLDKEKVEAAVMQGPNSIRRR